MIDLKHGDFFEIVKNIPDNTIDLIVCDPPYNFGSKGGGFFADNSSTQRTYCSELMKLDCCDFKPKEFLKIIRPKMKKFYGYFFCNKTIIKDYIEFAEENGYKYDLLVMSKSNPIPACNNHFMSDLEYIVMIREKGTYFAKKSDSVGIENFRKTYITTCKKGIHPAQKPVELLERYIKVSSKENDTILDCFMGSGSTGVACIHNHRNFIGIEKDDKYFELAKKRIENELIQPDLFQVS